jgi:release factor glutamine methyltransferase
MSDIAVSLALAQTPGLDRLDAQLLLLHALGVAPALASTQRAWLLAHGDENVPSAVQIQFLNNASRRLAGEPLAYITGHKAFFGLDLQVDGRVLIPRPDTETLVEWALEILAAPRPALRATPLAVLDLGTGSGAIALALKFHQPDAEVHAIDASSGALAVARANAQRLGLQVRFSQGSWLEGVQCEYDAIVANPPYIAAQDPHLAALAYEPQAALVAGADGLQDLRLIIGAAQRHLHPGAWLLVEHGYDQGTAVRELFVAAGYASVCTRRDLGTEERCTGGKMPLTGPTTSATALPATHWP